MLSHIQIDITNRCNMNCRHCRNGALRGPDITQLDLAVCRDIVDQAVALGCEWVNICGGEPLLHPDILDILSYTSDQCSTNLLTNGYFIDRTLAAALKKTGVGMVQMSLDSASPAEHNSLRRNVHAFSRVERAAAVLREQEVPVCFMVTMNRTNYESLPEILRVAEDMGVNFVNLRRLISQGSGQDDFDAMGLTREETARFLDQVRELETQYTIGVCLFPFYPFSNPEIVELYRANPESEACAGCSAGITGLAISSDGDILLCPHIPDSLGSIRTATLAEVWSDHPTILALRDRTNLKGACGICEFKNVCGGCRAHPYHVNGDLFAADELCNLPVHVGGRGSC